MNYSKQMEGKQNALYEAHSSDRCYMNCPYNSYNVCFLIWTFEPDTDTSPLLKSDILYFPNCIVWKLWPNDLIKSRTQTQPINSKLGVVYPLGFLVSVVDTVGIVEADYAKSQLYSTRALADAEKKDWTDVWSCEGGQST